MSFTSGYYFEEFEIKKDKLNLGSKLESFSTNQFLAASVAKLYIAAAVLLEVDKGIFHLQSRIEGTTVRVHIERMLTIIDNNAAHLLVRKIGKDTYKAYILKWKLKGTTIHEPPLSVSVTTPYDVSIFLKMLFSSGLGLSHASEKFLLNCMLNSTPRVLVIPNKYLLYQKTGEGLSIRKNMVLFNCVGVLKNPKTKKFVVFAIFSTHKGFWNTKALLKKINEIFSASLDSLCFY